MKNVLFVFRCGLIGAMIFLFVNTSTHITQSLGSENFTVWVCSKIHDQVLKKGDAWGESDYTRRTYLPSDLTSLKNIQEEHPEHPKTFVDRIKNASTPLENHIHNNLSAATIKLAATHEAGQEPSSAVKNAIIKDLNALIQSTSLYEKNRITDVRLTEETQRILVMRGRASNKELGTAFTKDDLVEDKYTQEVTPIDLNRMILTDAFPKVLAVIPHGSELWPNVSSHLKLAYYLGPGMKFGFLLGALVGAMLVAYERKWGDPLVHQVDQENSVPPKATFILPLWIPPALALSGLFFHGYFLGLVAFLLAGYTQGKSWIIISIRTLAFGVVLFWGIGTELWWSFGWSQTYPDLNRFLKIFFEG